MRNLTCLLLLLFVVSCASGKERSYTGSTPADPVVRSFLGIPLSDSIDFIWWQLFLRDNQYHLRCNYGIGRPNTNSFVNGGVKIELSGELNQNLLHLLNEDNSFLVGNG